MDAESQAARQRIESFIAGTLDDAGQQELAALLTQNATARQTFIESMDLHASLLWLMHADNSTAHGDEGLPAPTAQSSIPLLPPLQAFYPLPLSGAESKSPLQAESQHSMAALPRDAGTPRSSNVPVLGSTWSIGWLGAALAILLISAGIWLGRASRHDQAERPLARQALSEQADPPARPTAETTQFVAQILRASRDLAWDERSCPTDFLLRLRPHVPLHVSHGLLQIAFSSGATIIVQGPAIFTPTGAASGRLEAGRLTGHAANGNFTLSTHAADVIDLGTSFGVSVDAAHDTDVCVFDGEVRIVSHHSGAKEIWNITEGMAARIHADGSADYDNSPDAAVYARSINDLAGPELPRELSVVDIVCGGNGLESRLSGAIDITNGAADRGLQEAVRYRLGSDKFYRTEWHPLIDGVFAPELDIITMQIDSLGHEVELPLTQGRLWGPIWARRLDKSLQDATEGPDFWQHNTLESVLNRLASSRLGIVGMHPNVGITFNLRAIHLQQHRAVSAFRATLVNLDNSDRWREKDRNSNPVADFRVYVDGVLKYSRIGFGRHDGDDEIVVPLENKDARLTLVSTDGDRSIQYDHVALIDPVFELAGGVADDGAARPLKKQGRFHAPNPRRKPQ